MSVDFERPKGISTGVLLNTNNEALENYKKAKKRFNSVKQLEEQVGTLSQIVQELVTKVNDLHTNPR